MAFEQLKLSNQICFPIYAVSRLIIREYQPYLNKLGITYPQYLVLMVLWETDRITVNDIAQKLILNTNTITPLLKRMEQQGIISRERSDADERKVVIRLTPEGEKMKTKAACIPEELAGKINTSSFTIDQFIELRTSLNMLISDLTQKEDKQK